MSGQHNQPKRGSDAKHVLEGEHASGGSESDDVTRPLQQLVVGGATVEQRLEQPVGRQPLLHVVGLQTSGGGKAVLTKHASNTARGTGKRVSVTRREEDKVQ